MTIILEIGMREVLFCLLGIMMGTLGSHYIGDPLIGFGISFVGLLFVLLIKFIKQEQGNSA